MPVRMRGLLLLCIGAVLSGWGCVSTGTGSRAPASIVIRNSGKANLRSVSLLAPSPGGAVRHGQIAPVPAGVSQLFVRPEGAAPLPSKLTVQWISDSGVQYSRDVDLAELLKAAKKRPGAVLVFEIHDGRNVRYFLE